MLFAVELLVYTQAGWAFGGFKRSLLTLQSSLIRLWRRAKSLVSLGIEHTRYKLHNTKDWSTGEARDKGGVPSSKWPVNSYCQASISACFSACSSAFLVRNGFCSVFSLNGRWLACTAVFFFHGRLTATVVLGVLPGAMYTTNKSSEKICRIIIQVGTQRSASAGWRCRISIKIGSSPGFRGSVGGEIININLILRRCYPLLWKYRCFPDTCSCCSSASLAVEIRMRKSDIYRFTTRSHEFVHTHPCSKWVE